jgi:hypothetical protein
MENYATRRDLTDWPLKKKNLNLYTDNSSLSKMVSDIQGLQL